MVLNYVYKSWGLLLCFWWWILKQNIQSTAEYTWWKFFLSIKFWGFEILDSSPVTFHNLLLHSPFFHVEWEWLPNLPGLNGKMYVNVLPLILAYNKQSMHGSYFIVTKDQWIDTGISFTLHNLCISRRLQAGSRESKKEEHQKNEEKRM